MALHNKQAVLARIEMDGVVPVFYSDNIDTLRQVGRCVVASGLGMLEFTNRGDGAIEVFAELTHWSRSELPELTVGIGTVVDAATAGHALDLGASFVVGPCLSEEVALTCNARNVPYIPGCGTVTEIQMAYRLGADIVKLFPAASIGGPAFLKAVRAPCPWIAAIPTGGVEPIVESMRPWFRAGAPAVGMGSKLFPKQVIVEGDWSRLEQGLAETVTAVSQARAHEPT
jgi:2-dehydro-3-deoxyphosphogluconate aldolase/(4S)-4-hydroxy-2-oxoglutarate aldolase